MSTPSAESSNGANVGAIAGGSIAGCILCIILIGLILNGDPTYVFAFLLGGILSGELNGGTKMFNLGE